MIRWDSILWNKSIEIRSSETQYDCKKVSFFECDSYLLDNVHDFEKVTNELELEYSSSSWF